MGWDLKVSLGLTEGIRSNGQSKAEKKSNMSSNIDQCLNALMFPQLQMVCLS
jgi:hypothetical protein